MFKDRFDGFHSMKDSHCYGRLALFHVRSFIVAVLVVLVLVLISLVIFLVNSVVMSFVSNVVVFIFVRVIFQAGC